MERQISLSCLAAYLGWVAAGAVWVLSLYVDDHHNSLGELSILIGMASSTGTIRLYHLAHIRRMRAAVRTLQEGAPIMRPVPSP